MRNSDQFKAIDYDPSKKQEVDFAQNNILLFIAEEKILSSRTIYMWPKNIKELFLQRDCE